MKTTTSAATAAKRLILPDILPDIYMATSALNAVQNHLNTLQLAIEKDEHNRDLKLMRNGLTDYYKLVSNHAMRQRHREIFNELHEFNTKNHIGIFIKTTARIKSLISYYNKARTKLYEDLSLDTIKDIYACRTIVDSINSEDENIKLCYQIMDETIDFMISIGFTPCEKEEEKDTKNFNPKNFPNIVVPEKSYLSTENEKYVKDYILSPKADTGYQSLHVIFKDTDGNYFEYQVRTYSMDVEADHGKASHDYFKDKQLQKKHIPKIVIDKTKINMPGYRFFKNADGREVLLDDAGIEQSIPILLRTHRQTVT